MYKLNNLPAICANCDWRSCIVLWTIKSNKDDLDSNTSSTSNDFNFICIRSTAARDVSTINAVCCIVSLARFLGYGVCTKVKTARIAIDTSVVLSNLYNREIEKIKTTLSKLHEDLQYDHKLELEELLN